MAIWPTKGSQERFQALCPSLSWIPFTSFKSSLPLQMNILFGFSSLGQTSQTVHLISFIKTYHLYPYSKFGPKYYKKVLGAASPVRENWKFPSQYLLLLYLVECTTVGMVNENLLSKSCINYRPTRTCLLQKNCNDRWTPLASRKALWLKRIACIRYSLRACMTQGTGGVRKGSRVSQLFYSQHFRFFIVPI